MPSTPRFSHLRRSSGLALTLLVAVTPGCGSTGLNNVEYPATATGTTGDFIVGAHTITLEIARLAFGPAYFCATRAASADLCPTAVNELAAIAELDGIDPAPQALGTVRGTSGSIRSVHHGWGLTWFPRQSTAGSLDPSLPPHSAHFEGTATRAGTSFRFVATVDVIPQIQGELPIQGRRGSADISAETAALTLSIDPRAWWAQVDFAELEALGLAEVLIEADTRAHDSVTLAMIAGTGLDFAWPLAAAGASR